MGDYNSSLSPAPGESRIIALDVLRGFAILGILLMNIQSFSMIGAAYINPTAYGDLSGVNLKVWIFSHIFGDQKFLSLFSMLFGAGIVLFTSKVELKGANPFTLHLRRNLWLLLAGLVHAYVFWHGDILVSYSLCGILAYFFRRKNPKHLLLTGLIIFLVPLLLYLFFGFSLRFWSEQDLANLLNSWAPGYEQVSQEISAFQGSFLSQMEYRLPSAVFFQTFYFVTWSGWRVFGLMLVGMAFFKLGIISGVKTYKFYLNLTISCSIIGLTLIILGLIRNFEHGWTLQFSMFFGSLYNYLGSLFLAVSYLAIIVYWGRKSGSYLRNCLISAGRMAFSHYILQTLICTTIFYGHGLGLFGTFERWQQLLTVLVIWVIQLAISPLWLKYFLFGPVEWLWRSLTYWKLQPIRRANQ